MAWQGSLLRMLASITVVPHQRYAYHEKNHDTPIPHGTRKQVARVVCATLCWPVLVAVALGAVLVEVKAACQR